MKVPKFSLATSLAAVSTFALSAVPAATQAAATNVLEEIVVTAQKRAQSAQDIGMAISAYQGKQLEDLGFRDTRDIAALVPGMTMAQSFRGPPIYTLRGIGFNTPNLSATSPVGIYYDEVSYAYPAMSAGLSLDLERVEVLKGPQGTLYGRNTTGGLINNIARKPTADTEASVKVNGGSYGTYGLESILSGGLSEQVMARLAFKTDQSSQGWQESISHGGKLGEVNRSAARLSVLFRPTDSLETLFTVNWWNDKSDTQAAQSIQVYPEALIDQGIPPSGWPAAAAALSIPPQIFGQAIANPTSNRQANWVVSQLPWGGTVGGHNFTAAPLGPKKDDDMYSLALRADWKFSPAVTLTSLTSYAQFRRDEVIDVAGWDIENAIGRGLGSIKSFSQELRLSGATDKLKWITGAFYSSDKLDDNDLSWGGTITTLYPLRVLGAGAAAAAGQSVAAQEDIFWGFRDWQNQTHTDVTTDAIFGQLEYRLVKSLNLTAGLRYTEDKLKFAGCSKDQGDNSIAATWNGFFNLFAHIPANVAPGGCVTYLADLTPALMGLAPFPAQGIVNRELREHNISGRLALDWDITDNVMVYGSFARGFKSGAFPNLDANVAVQYDPAVQEKVLAYEIGVKSRPLPTLQLNSAVYYYDYTDKQVFGGVADIIFNQLNRIVNVPKSRIWGAELEGTWSITHALTAHVAANYLNTKIKTYVGYNDFGLVKDFAGDELNYSPHFQMAALLTYAFDMSTSLAGRVTIDAQHTSDQQADFEGDPRFKIDAYTLVGANFGVQTSDGHWEANAYVRNITDKYYWNSAAFQADSITRYTGMPRTWGLSLKYSFL